MGDIADQHAEDFWSLLGNRVMGLVANVSVATFANKDDLHKAAATSNAIEIAAALFPTFAYKSGALRY